MEQLKLDRRLVRRRNWITKEELEKGLEALPDVSHKIARDDDPPVDSSDDVRNGSEGGSDQGPVSGSDSGPASSSDLGSVSRSNLGATSGSDTGSEGWFS